VGKEMKDMKMEERTFIIRQRNGRKGEEKMYKTKQEKKASRRGEEDV
jgi:hypothetical protein